MNTILRVDSRTGRIRFVEAVEDEVRVGGRSFIVHHLLNEVDPACDPLGRRNRFILAAGLLGDTRLTTAGRLSVGAKSPLTGGVKESNVGGIAGRRLGRLGLKAIVLEDAPDEDLCRVLVVRKDGAELVDKPSLKGLGVTQTLKALAKEYGKKPGLLCIGPAGEYKLGASIVATTDHTGVQVRTAGRGGLGAVMGSKGVKAVVLDDSGTTAPVMADAGMFTEAAREVANIIKNDPKTDNRHDFGTPAVLSLCNTLGILPTRNFSAGTFEDADRINGDAVAELIHSRGGEGKWGLPCVQGCVISCSNIFPNPDGKAHVASLQYENIALLGSNLGIGDIDEIAILNDLCNDVGIDTIDGGAAIGIAMEAGLLEFGDSAGAGDLLRQVGLGTPLGRIIGSGAALTGRVLGARRVPVVKGQAMPAYDPRALKGIGVTYATSAMGADHTAGNTLETVRYLDPLSAEGQVAISHRLQIRGAILDTLGVCLFLRPAFVKNPDLTARLINGRYGWDWTYGDVQAMGRQCLRLEAEFNRLAGMDKTGCDVPEFMRSEPLPPKNTVYDISRDEMDGIWETAIEKDIF